MQTGTILSAGFKQAVQKGSLKQEQRRFVQLTLPTLIIKRNHGKEGGGTSTSVLLEEWFTQDISTLMPV